MFPTAVHDVLAQLACEHSRLVVYLFDLEQREWLYANRNDPAVLDAVCPPDDAVWRDGRCARQVRLQVAQGSWRQVRIHEQVVAWDAGNRPRQVLGIAVGFFSPDPADEESLHEDPGLRLAEHERQLIACEIHDGLIQDIVGAKLVVEAITARLAAQSGSAVDEWKLVESLLGKAIAEGRRLIHGLRPLAIEGLGIVEAVQRQIGEETADTGLRVEFSHGVSASRLPPLVQGAIVRIVREALCNVKRHAEVDQAEVRLTQQGDQILLEVEDSGIGFDPNSLGGNRYGLKGIRERAAILEGHASIESRPGGGTRLSVRIPWTTCPAAGCEASLHCDHPQRAAD